MYVSIRHQVISKGAVLSFDDPHTPHTTHEDIPAFSKAYN